MATTTAKPVRRETFTAIRDSGKVRPLIIELHPTWARLRLKGMRYFHTVTYDQIWTLGARNAAEALRAEKAAARKAKHERTKAKS